MWYKSECWMTYCGLHVNPKSPLCFDDGTYYLGRSYDVEHNQVLIRCPLERKTPCVFRESIFDQTAIGKPFSRHCVSEPVNCSYDYEQSVEKAYMEENQRFSKELDAFMYKHPQFRGCLCLIRGDTGTIVFDRFTYNHNYCINCKKEQCGLTGKMRDLILVNIVGDYDYVYMPDSLNAKKVREVGRQISKFPMTMESATRMMKSIESLSEYSFFQNYSMTKPTRIYLKKVNARRNLFDDLNAVAEGIEVIHSKDIVRANKQEKRDLREKRRKQKNVYPVKKIKRWAEEYLGLDTPSDIRNIAKQKLIDHGIDVDTIRVNFLTESISL